MKLPISLFLVVATAFVALPAMAEDIIAPGDPVLAIDLDPVFVSNSDYPSNDGAPNALDGITYTKYANTGGAYSGLILTPSAGPAAVRSFVITTASDAPARDPISWMLYGTNDPIVSANNSRGDAENWELIDQGQLDTPEARLTAGAPVTVANDTAYSSYLILFPTVRGGAATTVMQFAEIQFYGTTDGTGAPLLVPGDPALAVHQPPLDSRSPANETAVNLLDGDPSTKYLNFGKLYTGFIVTPASGPSVIQSFQLTTANDADVRDPASWILYGTNDEIVSPEHGTGEEENWTEIARGNVALPTARLSPGPLVTFENTTEWRSYLMVFPTVRNAVTANSMQIGDVQFYTTDDGSDWGVLGVDDFIIPIQQRYHLSGHRAMNNEQPQKLVDGQINTKYLNFGKRNTGVIITPSAPGVVRSMVLTTANDAPERDPVNFVLYGTNDPIVSADNSTGTAENWTLIAKGALDLPLDRNTDAEPVNFANETAWASYRLVFPSVRNDVTANSMQIAEVQFYPEPNGGGAGILAPDNTVRAVMLPSTNSSYPANENPANLLDEDPGTKYLNFAKRNSGFIVTPSAGPKVVRSFAITTANDAQPRDPASWELYGTNDPIVSGDNSEGNLENWTLVAKGTLELSDDRFYIPLLPDEAVSFENSTAWTSWMMVFPTVKNDGSANSMQIADIQFYTEAGGGGEPVLAPGDDIRAIARFSSTSDSPANETVDMAVDGSPFTKYLNRGGVNSGLIVTPSGGPSVVTGLRLYTANDFPGRDPASYALYGTNDPVTSANHSLGDGENWTLIASGPIELPEERDGAEASVTFPNTTAWTSYRFVVTSLKDNALGLMQFSEIQLDGVFGQGQPSDPPFHITNVTATGNPTQSVTLTWESVAGASYTIQTSDGLSGWTAAGTHVATGPVSTATVEVNGAPRRFFRIVRNANP